MLTALTTTITTIIARFKQYIMVLITIMIAHTMHNGPDNLWKSTQVTQDSLCKP